MMSIVSGMGCCVKGESANSLAFLHGLESLDPLRTVLLREAAVVGDAVTPKLISVTVVAHHVVPVETGKARGELFEGDFVLHVAHYSRVQGVRQGKSQRIEGIQFRTMTAQSSAILIAGANTTTTAPKTIPFTRLLLLLFFMPLL